MNVGLPKIYCKQFTFAIFSNCVNQSSVNLPFVFLIQQFPAVPFSRLASCMICVKGRL